MNVRVLDVRPGNFGFKWEVKIQMCATGTVRQYRIDENDGLWAVDPDGFNRPIRGKRLNLDGLKTQRGRVRRVDTFFFNM